MKKKKCPICGPFLDEENELRCSRFPICTYQETTDKELNRFVMYDLETSGFKDSDHIIEIGAIYVEDGKVVDGFDKLCNPGIFINQRITQVTNITNDMLKDKESEESVLKEFIEWVHSKNTDVCVGHNIDAFDNRMLNAACKKYRQQMPFHRTLDTLKMARNLKLKERGVVQDYKQETLANEYCHFTYSAHRAIQDVEALFRIFEVLRKEYQQLPIINI